MCGFAGSISLDGHQADADVVRRMASCQWRRGPDDEGTVLLDHIALGFRRLSILDLSPAGHQPFLSEDGSLAIVFNGEIFNFVELRTELSAKGHRFRSGSDTEVLLAAYVEWGIECLPRFNGMWAFLIADQRKGLLFGARDRFGIKPMYRARHGSTHYFASEIKALRQAIPSLDAVNWTLAARLLADGRLDNIATQGQTFYEGVTEVPAAHGFTITRGGVERSWRYWQLPEEDPQPISDPVGELREILTDSVRLRLRSDVPVGVALSGGMDSSTIIAMMSRLAGTEDGRAMHGLHAFSYMPKEFDEERYIMDSVALTGATLHRTSMAPAELWRTLPDVLDAHDEPLHSPTALAGYQVYALAARAGVRVVLGGQGADESLAGYSPYFEEYWLDQMRRARLLSVLGAVREYAPAHGQQVSSLLKLLAYRFAATTIPRPRRRGPKPAAYEQWLLPQAVELSHGLAPEPAGRGLTTQLKRSVELHPLPLFLRIEDRNSMAHSIEARLPFMDYRVVSFAFRLSNDWKIRGPWNKYVLRQATKGIVPESIRTRVDKMGFPTGFSAWIRGPLQGMVRERLADSSIQRLGLVNPAMVQRYFEAHVRGEADHGMAIFHVLQLAEWHERIVKGQPTAIRAA